MCTHTWPTGLDPTGGSIVRLHTTPLHWSSTNGATLPNTGDFVTHLPHFLSYRVKEGSTTDLEKKL